MLKKYTYHLAHFILLEKNEASADRRKNLRPGDIKALHDYAERFVFKKDKKVQAQHFGHHVSLSMKGVELRYFEKEEIDK